jgi:hypothetical protein
VSQQYPHQHQAPQPYQQPQPPKKSWFARHKVLTAIGSIFAIIVIISIASSGNSPSDGTAAPSVADAKQADEEKPAAKKEQSQADQFKAFVAKNGTATEKQAMDHVTKVQGADERNDILDSAEVYTDYSGGLTGPDQSNGKLIASAFADWRNSDNGLVTVYDKDGEILSNGNF